MTENQITKCRQRLERFLLDLLEPIGRSERRHWEELYVRGPDRSSTRLGRAGPDCARRCGIRRGNAVSRCAGAARSPLRGWHRATSRSLDQTTQDQSAGIQRAWCSAEEMGLRRPKAEFGEDVALKAKGWKDVRWREGSK